MPSAYYLMIPLFVLLSAASAASYADTARRHWSYVPGMMILGSLTTLIFAYGSKLLDDKSRIFVYSLAYDCMMALCYYILPLIVLGVRVNAGVMIGSVLIIVGLIIIKGTS